MSNTPTSIPPISTPPKSIPRSNDPISGEYFLGDPLISKSKKGKAVMPQERVDTLHRLGSGRSREQKRSHRPSGKGIGAAILATVAGATFMVANNQIDKSNERAAVEYERSALEAPKTALKGEIILNPGVNVRKEPAIDNADEYDQGNIAFTVKDGQRLIVTDPVSVALTEEDTWFAFNMNKGGPDDSEYVTMWVSSEVLNQLNAEGQPYGQLGIEGLYDNGLGQQVNVDQYGMFSVEGNPVSIARLEN